MAKTKKIIQFRYYTMPVGDYILAELGDGWIREYGLGYGDMQHFHNYMEVGYCYDGHGKILVEDQEYRYQAGTFTIIPENIPHTTISDPGNKCKWEFLFIDIDEFVSNEMEKSRLSAEELVRKVNEQVFIENDDGRKNLAQFIHMIIEECRQKKPFYKDVLKGLLYSFIVEIIRMNGEEITFDRHQSSRYISTAMNYVKEHFFEDIKISKIATICGLSESHFRKIFEDAMNMKPNDYINFVRIMEACKIIRKEDISMEELGIRVGYMTPSTFSRNFKKITGKTPYQWKTEERTKNSFMTDANITAEKGWT